VTEGATAGPADRAPRPWAAWVLAARPRTLVAGVVPVAVGTAVAARDGLFRAGPALAALLGALLIQIGTNLANDAFDFRRGADTGARLGPARATQRGWLGPTEVLRGAWICFGSAVVIGIYLALAAGPAIVLVGLLSIAAGYAYTGGPFPLAYHGLGDAFVMLFFGLVAVGGTYFVQSGRVSWTALAAGVPVGALGVALLAVNNTRDAVTDAAAGKRTLVVRFGAGFGRLEYLSMLGLGALVPVLLWWAGAATAWVLLALGAAPLAVGPVRSLWTESGAALNRTLAQTARLQLAYGVLFAVGLAR
jgi:1,4-dihydroxy-2-naphthoate octaprenyltransferase